jgi:hypothetical protein
LQDDRFRRLYADLAEDIGRERFAAYLDRGPRSAVEMGRAEEQQIRRRVGVGNWLLAREFDLDLKRYGYLLAEERDLDGQQLAAAQREIRFNSDMDRLRRMPQSETASELRRSAEIVAVQARLRELSQEFAEVSRSPVWRTVKRLDSARRMLSRAAALALSLF